MKTLQPKAPLMEHAMLRRVIVGLTFAVALAFLAFGTATPADAQAAPLCTRFGPAPADLDNWGPCPTAPNIVVTTSNVGSIGGPTDYHLHLRDTAGASAACSTNEKYLGDWTQKMGGCGEFCFDFKLFKSGTPPASVHPSFSIYNGTQRATFVANVLLTSADPWQQHICAPIALGAVPPPSSQGHWVVNSGSWNSIITGVTMIQLPVDFTSDPSEEVGYDNLCMSPVPCPPPPPPEIKGCLHDLKVAVKCNPDGTYTVTLSGSSFTGSDITLTSQTPGVNVTPPQQPWAATTTWTVTGATAGQTVTLTANATQLGHGSAEGSDLCCSAEIKIVMPECPKGTVIVEKKVKNDTEASLSTINSLVFPIGLSCTAPSNLNVSFGLSNGGTHTENNVPYTSVCTVTESVSTLPPVPKDVCGKGSTAVWLPPVITVTPSATIGAPVTAFTVVNELKCVKNDLGTLSVTKTVAPDPRGIGLTLTFPMTVTCTNPNSSHPLNVPGNTSTVPFNVPVGSHCTVTETQPALPAGCTWLPPVFSPPGGVTIASGLNQELVTNGYRCREVCPPPQVMNAAGVCGCPPPMVTGATPNTCLCPQGTTLVDGKCVPVDACQPPLVMIPGVGCRCPDGLVLVNGKCVKRLVCDSPLVPNAAGTDCVCRRGLVLRRGKCVESIVCREPARLNRAGTACVCPEGWVKKGNACEKERKRPTVSPNDVIQILPYVIPHGGGGGRPSPKPRGDTPGKR
jgi:hypothetical protein